MKASLRHRFKEVIDSIYKNQKSDQEDCGQLQEFLEVAVLREFVFAQALRVFRGRHGVCRAVHRRLFQQRGIRHDIFLFIGGIELHAVPAHLIRLEEFGVALKVHDHGEEVDDKEARHCAIDRYDIDKVNLRDALQRQGQTQVNEIRGHL